MCLTHRYCIEVLKLVDVYSRKKPSRSKNVHFNLFNPLPYSKQKAAKDLCFLCGCATNRKRRFQDGTQESLRILLLLFLEYRTHTSVCTRMRYAHIINTEVVASAKMINIAINCHGSFNRSTTNKTNVITTPTITKQRNEEQYEVIYVVLRGRLRSRSSAKFPNTE